MGIHSPQVGQHQHVGTELGVVRGNAQLLENRRHRGLQGVAVNEFRLVVTDFKPLKHWLSPSRLV